MYTFFTFSIIFVSIRLFSGGYHAKTYGRCFIISNAVYLARQIRDLERANIRLQMKNIQQVMQRMLELLLDKLEKACTTMSEDTWHEEISPDSLRKILENISVSEYGPERTAALFDTFLRYSLVWFEYSFSYSVDDFHIFPLLHSKYSFPVQKDNFQGVCEAIKEERSRFRLIFLFQTEKYSPQIPNCDWFFPQFYAVPIHKAHA